MKNPIRLTPTLLTGEGNGFTTSGGNKGGLRTILTDDQGNMILLSPGGGEGSVINDVSWDKLTNTLTLSTSDGDFTVEQSEFSKIIVDEVDAKKTFDLLIQDEINSTWLRVRKSDGVVRGTLDDRITAENNGGIRVGVRNPDGTTLAGIGARDLNPDSENPSGPYYEYQNGEIRILTSDYKANEGETINIQSNSGEFRVIMSDSSTLIGGLLHFFEFTESNLILPEPVLPENQTPFSILTKSQINSLIGDVGKLGFGVARRDTDFQLPTTATTIDFTPGIGDFTSSNGYFNVKDTSTLTLNEPGLYNISVLCNVLKEANGSTGSMKLGLGIGANQPAKGFWRTHKPSEAGSGDISSVVLQDNFKITTATDISIWGINNGTGSITLTNNDDNFAMRVTLTYLGEV